MSKVFEHLIPSDTALFLCDLQEDYAYKIGKDFQEVVNNSTKMLRAALQFGISIAVTALQGLGHTVTEIRTEFPEFEEKLIVKIRCSMCSSSLMDSFQHKSCMFLCGFETHGAIKDTALDLIKLGYSVVLITDACSSAFSGDRDKALEELEGEGCHLMTVSEALQSIRTFSNVGRKDCAIDTHPRTTGSQKTKGHEEDSHGNPSEEPFISRKPNTTPSDDSGYKTRKSLFQNDPSSTNWDETEGFTSRQRTFRYSRRLAAKQDKQGLSPRQRSQTFTQEEHFDMSKSRRKRSSTLVSSSEKEESLEERKTNFGFGRVISPFDVQMGWKRSDRIWKRQTSSRPHNLERSCLIL